jgi:hypothetical protein
LCFDTDVPLLLGDGEASEIKINALEAVDISGSTKLVLGGSFSIVESSITVI